jgi:psiF repeat
VQTLITFTFIHVWFSIEGRVFGFLHPRGFDMTLSARIAAAALASLLLSGSAFAQSTTTPAAKTEAPAADKAAPSTDKKARSAASLECSKEADEKGLHGKERKKFRSECRKEKAGTAGDTKMK